MLELDRILWTSEQISSLVVARRESAGHTPVEFTLSTLGESVVTLTGCCAVALMWHRTPARKIALNLARIHIVSVMFFLHFTLVLQLYFVSLVCMSAITLTPFIEGRWEIYSAFIKR